MAKTPWLCWAKAPRPWSCSIGCERDPQPHRGSVWNRTCSHGNSASQNTLEIVAEEGPPLPTPILCSWVWFPGMMFSSKPREEQEQKGGWRLKPEGRGSEGRF